MKIAKYPELDSDRPITILSIVNKDRADKNIFKIRKELFEDPVIEKTLSYWSIFNEDKEEGGYNCCEAFNIGMEEAVCSDILIYSTGDVIISPQLLWRAYGLLLKVESPVVAFRMDEEPNGCWIKNDNSLGDFIMVKRDWMLSIGGWDERLLQWGVMDYDVGARLSLLLNKGFVCLGMKEEDRVRHMYHPRREDSWYREQNKKNWNIINTQGYWTKLAYEEKKKERENKRREEKESNNFYDAKYYAFPYSKEERESMSLTD